MNRPLLLGLGLLLCAGCVKASELEERLQPLEQKTVILQNEQQELQLRIASNEHRTESLQDQFNAMPGQTKRDGLKTSGRKIPDSGRAVRPESRTKPAVQTKDPGKTPRPAQTVQASPATQSPSPVLKAPEAAQSAPVSASQPSVPAPSPATSPAAPPSASVPAPSPATSPAAPPSASVPAQTPAAALSAVPPAVPPSSSPAAPAATVPDNTPPLSTGTLRVDNGPSGNAEPPVSRAPAKGESPAYQRALKMYERGRYIEAEALFDAFMRDYPQGRLLPNALYWKGECQYSRGNYADSIFVFKDVTARFPKHPKAPDALLKTALAYKQLGDMDNARLHFCVLGEDYPDSPLLRRGKALGLQ